MFLDGRIEWPFLAATEAKADLTPTSVSVKVGQMDTSREAVMLKADFSG